MNVEDENFLYGKPVEEIDEPLDTAPKIVEELELRKLDTEEKEKVRKEKRYFSAFKLIVGCLIFLGIIYMTDVVCSFVLHRELSGITDSIIEIIKTLLFTLSGYLFARKENGD